MSPVVCVQSPRRPGLPARSLHDALPIAVCRSTILLPAMLGPVIIRIWYSLLFRRMSFGIKGSPAGKFLSTTGWRPFLISIRSEEHTSELQSRGHLVCRLLLEQKKERHQE